MGTKHKVLSFDMAEFLQTPDEVVEYLNQVIVDGDNDELVRALGHIAKARGMTEIAEKSGLGRESLYKALRPGAKPQYATVAKVLSALGVGIRAISLPTPRLKRDARHSKPVRGRKVVRKRA